MGRGRHGDHPGRLANRRPPRVVELKLGEVGCSHVSQAPDEMRQLAMELQILVDKAGIPVLAIRRVLGLNDASANGANAASKTLTVSHS
jgi:hypothetical protein